MNTTRREAEDDARHVMGAVPIILAASVLGPLFVCAVAVLVWLFR